MRPTDTGFPVDRDGTCMDKHLKRRNPHSKHATILLLGDLVAMVTMYEL